MLLMLLPLQFSWAAVESYCAHEERVGAAQVARHVQHADVSNAAAADAAAAATDAGALNDIGCDSCHCHGHCTGILTGMREVGPRPTGARPTAELDAIGGTHAPTRPERPQWAPLA